MANRELQVVGAHWQSTFVDRQHAPRPSRAPSRATTFSDLSPGTFPRQCRPLGGIGRGKLGSSRPGGRTQRGCPSAERDGTHRSWDQSARMTGRSVGRHEVRTYKCVCGDLLKFGSWGERACRRVEWTSVDRSALSCRSVVPVLMLSRVSLAPGRPTTPAPLVPMCELAQGSLDARFVGRTGGV